MIQLITNIVKTIPKSVASEKQQDNFAKSFLQHKYPAFVAILGNTHRALITLKTQFFLFNILIKIIYFIN